MIVHNRWSIYNFRKLNRPLCIDEGNERTGGLVAWECVKTTNESILFHLTFELLLQIMKIRNSKMKETRGMRLISSRFFHFFHSRHPSIVVYNIHRQAAATLEPIFSFVNNWLLIFQHAQVHFLCFKYAHIPILKRKWINVWKILSKKFSPVRIAIAVLILFFVPTHPLV